MAQKNVHVIACAEGWAVEENGRQLSVRHTRPQAEQIARAFATGGRAQVIVHTRDGRIERNASDAKDPRNVKA